MFNHEVVVTMKQKLRLSSEVVYVFFHLSLKYLVWEFAQLIYKLAHQTCVGSHLNRGYFASFLGLY